MKKSLLSLAALAGFAFAVNAQEATPLYATGDFAASNWAPDAPAQFEFVDGNYNLLIEEVSMFKISTAMGSWDDFNGGALQAAASGWKADEKVLLEAGDSNIVLPWKGDWNIMVSPELTYFVATTTTPGPEGPTAIYVRGGMNGWGVDDAWQMETLDGHLYFLRDVTIGNGVEWKIADENWAAINYGVEGSDPVVLDENFDLAYNGSNIILDGVEEGQNVDILFLLDKALLLVCAHTEEPTPLYATGDFEASNWDAAEPAEFIHVGDSYILYVEAASMFKISTAKGSWEDFNGSALTINNKNWDPDEYEELVSGDSNILLPWKGDWLIMVTDDLSTIALIAYSEKPAEALEIYVRGGMNGWGVDEAWKLTSEDGVVYTLKNVVIAAGVEWKIADANWAKVNYGGSGDPIVVDELFDLVYNGNNLTLEVEDGQVVNLYFNIEDETLLVEAAASSITSVGNDANAPAVYYNLAGVKVANPVNGLYIVKQGDVARKAYIVK